MTPQEITELRDRLIANFMGADVVLPYHRSYDALMPVVERIEQIGFRVDIDRTSCLIEDIKVFHNEADTKIEAIYKSAIQFIQWFNQQN